MKCWCLFCCIRLNDWILLWSCVTIKLASLSPYELLCCVLLIFDAKYAQLIARCSSNIRMLPSNLEIILIVDLDTCILCGGRK